MSRLVSGETFATYLIVYCGYACFSRLSFSELAAAQAIWFLMDLVLGESMQAAIQRLPATRT